MVTISNGINTFEVSKGAVDCYVRLGFHVVDGGKHVIDDVEDNIVHEAIVTDPDAVYIEELLEKPISQWNKTEVKKFAAIKDIDIGGTKTVNDAKDRIKAILEEESKNS